MNYKPTYQELEESISRYEKLIHSVSEGFVKSDKQGYIISTNMSFAEICGYKSPEEMVGINMAKLFANSTDRDRMLEVLKKDDILRNHELQLRKKDGTIFWSLNNISNIVNAEVEIIGKQGLILDITKRKEADIKLKESEQASNSKRIDNSSILCFNKI